MKNHEPWKAWTLLGTLCVLAIFINMAVTPIVSPPAFRTTPTPTSSPSIEQAPVAPPFSSVSPVVTVTPNEPDPPKIWPDDFTPTRTIRIPDPARPSTGVMDFTFKPGDDVQVEVAQWWVIHAQKWSDSIEHSKNNMKDFREAGTRKVRFRLKNGASQTDVRFSIEHKNPDDYKPLPPIDPQTFGNAKFVYNSIQGVNDNRHIIIDFSIENTDSSKTIGVGLHAPYSMMVDPNPRLVGSFTDEDGNEYFLDEMSGIRNMHSLLEDLASIGPGESRKISLRFVKRRGRQGQPRWFKLRAEVVINHDWQRTTYTPSESLAPGCRIETLNWHIPVCYQE